MAKSFAQSKGARFERKVIELLQPVVNEIYSMHGLEQPKLQRNTLQADGGGFDITGLHWMALECKSQETLNVNTWWLQAVGQAKTGQTPILLYKQNNVQIRAVMFGLLTTGGASNIRCPVNVDLDSFMLYFRHRLIKELTE